VQKCAVMIIDKIVESQMRRELEFFIDTEPW
jgi:hypothetical protein